MKIRNEAHLSYCTNIHPGESWEEVFASLKQYTLAVKEKMAPETDFGIGLRLSYESAVTLSQAENCSAFKNWLDENKTYVFTINGFPYGNFHGQQVKDQVHAPDWLSRERVNYTCMLFDLLAQLLPKGMEGGISTSPLSYKYWYAIEEDRDLAKKKSCEHLVAVVLHLVQLNKWTGKKMHLDIEPEPDGLLENTDDFIDFFQNYLLKDGVIALIRQLKCTGAEARHYIREHLQLCYDVCHFAVAFEKPETVIQKMADSRIKIGKLQISAALRCPVTDEVTTAELCRRLNQFNEPVYLHQAVLRTKSGALLKYPDLQQGIEAMQQHDPEELRTHFHVPIFLPDYQGLYSTQEDIVTALEIWTKQPYTAHLEVETYTWDVLPSQLQMDLTDAIQRELAWVLHCIEHKKENQKPPVKGIKYAANSGHKHSRTHFRVIKG